MPNLVQDVSLEIWECEENVGRVIFSSFIEKILETFEKIRATNFLVYWSHIVL